MKMTKYETLYHEDHDATLKHKYGKRILKLSLLSFYLIFYFPYIFFFFFLFLYFFFFYFFVGFFGLFYLIWASLASFTLFPHMGQCSNNGDHHTFIYLQLKNYNSILEQNMTLYECLMHMRTI
jgi:hypothetical protein